MSVEKALPNSMKIILSISLPKQEPIICILSYFDQNNYAGGTLELKNPWKFFQITFYGGFKTNDEFEFTSFIKYPDEIFDLEMKIRAATTTDVDFRIKCIIPTLRKEFGSMFTFKPLSIDDFQLYVILNINEEKFGGGMSLKFDFQNPNLLIKIFTPVISGEFNMGARYNLTNSTGDILLYFNEANIQVRYDLPKGSFSAETQFNVDDFIKTFIGSITNISIPLTKLVKLSVHYEYFQTGRIDLYLEEIGNLKATFEFRNFKFLSNFQIALHNRNFSKSAYLSFDYRKSGVFEFVIKDNAESLGIIISDESLEAKSRKIRATLSSPSLGSTEINMATNLTQGIFVFSTKNGIHKLSYNIDMTEKTLTINVESPYLNNGFSSQWQA